MSDLFASGKSPLGIVAGGGTLPFAVADAVVQQGRAPVLLALRGFCDAERVRSYRHHWIVLGQFGRIPRLLRQEGCIDVVLMGALVRPSLSEVRLDWFTVRNMPRLVRAFRGGDDHLLVGVARLFEAEGFRLVGAADVAPNLTMPEGVITRNRPDPVALADAAKGVALLRAISPFDVGQAAVVIEGNVVAVEDIGGTDALLVRVARLRDDGRLRTTPGRGVLVKAPKTGQDLRFDMPTLGPRTVEGASAAQLAGIAVAAGRTLLAEPQAVTEAADRAGLFVAGIPA